MIRVIKFLIIKEFKQIFRNKSMLPLIFMMPLLQLLILANAATFEIKNLNIVIIDKDQTSLSRNIAGKFKGSKYFNIVGYTFNQKTAEREIQNRHADLYIEIPNNFERDLIREQTNKILVVVNAIDGAKGSISNFYVQNIINDVNKEIAEKYLIQSNTLVAADFKQIDLNYSFWYNPDLNYKTFMVPGILVLLVTLIGTFLSSMNIVREKEIGTLESINVTPINKIQFIIGKQTPIWIIGMFELVFGLTLAELVYHIPFLGSPVVLFTFGALYLSLALGVGLLISTVTETQQQAMFFTWFFMMLFILLGGLFTAIENMPAWAQTITLFNPIRYFIEVVRLVMLKGAGFADVKNHLIVISIMSVVINGLAVFRYRKTT